MQKELKTAELDLNSTAEKNRHVNLMILINNIFRCWLFQYIFDHWRTEVGGYCAMAPLRP